MGTMRRMWRRLRFRLGWLVPLGRKGPVEVELWNTQIDRDAAIFGGPAASREQMAEQRVRLRRRASRAQKSAAVAPYALALFMAAGLYAGAAQMKIEGSDAARAAVIGLCVAGAAILVALWRMLVKPALGGYDVHVRAVLRFLDAEGGEGREIEAVDWLDRHWDWPAPPKMFEGTTYLARGVRRGRAFLILSEHESGDDAWGPPVQRTCVFLAGRASESRELGDQIVPVMLVKCHLALTPAGLFAWWPHAADFGRQPPEWFGAVLDGLLDVADRELGPPG